MPERVKIAFIEQDAGIGGAEINLFYLFQGMNREVFHPVVIVPCEGPFTERLKELGVRYCIVPQAKLVSTSFFLFGSKIFDPLAVLFDIFIFLPTIWRISSFLRREQIDVVHTNSMVAHIYGSIAARLAKVPCIWHMQDIVDPNMAFGLVLRSLVLIGEYLPQRIIVVSQAVGKMFAEACGSKVRVIYNGTDTENFSPGADGQRIRREFGIADDEAVIGIVGRLTQWKGQREFLKAAAVVAERHPHVKFLIIGDAVFGTEAFKNELLKLVDKLGISSRVIFTGFRSDVPLLLRALDILVHASITPEPFGLVIIEGMAVEIPVVASVHGGVKEIIDDGMDGFLVDPSNTEALAGRLLELLEDAALRRNVAAAGRRKVIYKFPIGKFVDQFEKLYLETVR